MIYQVMEGSVPLFFVVMNRVLLLIVLTVFSVGLTFAQTGGLKGKVRASNGDSIEGATVTARQDSEDLKTVRTDRKGKFLLNGLKPGVYNIVFSKNGFSSGLLFKVEVVANDIRDLGDRLILTVDQGTQVIINGSVYDENGVSVYGAKVTIERVLSDGSARKLGTGYTGRTGEFTFKFPESNDRFRVTVSAKGEKETKEVVAEGAAIYRLAFTLGLTQER